jgi:tRNA-dihydrouridine synthase
MTLWLRRTGLASLVDADRADYLVIEHDKVIGRINEERYVPADVRWFWSITEHVDPALGIVTNGRVPSLEEAKERFESSWSKVREAQGQQRPE